MVTEKAVRFMMIWPIAFLCSAGELNVFQFDCDGNTENWYAAPGVGNFSVSGGSLFYELSAPHDQFVRTQDLTGRNIDCGTFRRLKIRIKSETSGRKGQFYFITDQTPVWNNVRFSIQSPDPDFQTYTVDFSQHPGWIGTLKFLRFDIPGAVGPVFIDSIKFIQE